MKKWIIKILRSLLSKLDPENPNEILDAGFVLLTGVKRSEVLSSSGDPRRNEITWHNPKHNRTLSMMVDNETSDALMSYIRQGQKTHVHHKVLQRSMKELKVSVLKKAKSVSAHLKELHKKAGKIDKKLASLKKQKSKKKGKR
jgi:hypothetical protein